MELARLGLDAVLREDWGALEDVILEREALMSNPGRDIPEPLLSNLKNLDGLTVRELSKKRSETRAKLQTLMHSRGTPGKPIHPKVKGFNITA